MTALTECRILGIRSGEQVLVPPVEWDPQTGAALDHELVEVGPAGTVTAWTWVSKPTEQHPLEQPFAFALIKLDGADTAFLHAVEAGSPEALHSASRVTPRWRPQRIGRIDDIECFVLGEEPVVPDDQIGRSEPVTMMDFNASIAYRETAAANALRVVEASAERRLIGHRCPICERTYNGGRGFCPVDAVELGEQHEIELAQRGTITNFTIVTPVQYPGQTETEPFVRAMVLLDTPEGLPPRPPASGSTDSDDRRHDVILTYQPLIDIPVAQVRVGLRVVARWLPAEQPAPASGGMGGAIGYLAGWAASGEPDVQDPDLVNRIF